MVNAEWRCVERGRGYFRKWIARPAFHFGIRIGTAMVHAHGIDREPESSAPVEYDLVEVAAAMRSLTERIAQDTTDRGPLDVLVAVAVEGVPGARWASVSMRRGERFTTTASTANEAVRADLLQYDIGSGPCVDAVLEDSVYVTGDVRSEPRWNEWGQRVSVEVGVNSVFSQRLHLQGQDNVVAGLNIYSDAPNAFNRQAIGVGLILATHGALALSQMLATRRAGHLAKALQSNREIGVAMGILMHQHHFTEQEAIDVLRVASQNSNRKLAELAADVARTGTLSIEQRGH